MRLSSRLPVWSIVCPVAAWGLFALHLTGYAAAWGGVLQVLLVSGLVGAILAAVFHAEVVAHRVG